jgi:hypothetical protein
MSASLLTERSRFFALCLSAAAALLPVSGLRSATAAPPVASPPPSAAPAAPAADPNRLVGTWRVDLRPTPDAPPYYQTFVISSVKDDRLSGTFYNTEIRDGRTNKDWGAAVYFAFTTNDGSGAYHTAGRLTSNGRLEGTTHAVGRGFLSVWTAERVLAAAEQRPGSGNGGLMSPSQSTQTARSIPGSSGTDRKGGDG